MSKKEERLEEYITQLEIKDGANKEFKRRNKDTMFNNFVNDPVICRDNTEEENKMIEEFLRKRDK